MDSISIKMVTWIMFVSFLGSQGTDWFPYPDSQTGLLGPTETFFSDYGGNVASYPVNCEYLTVCNQNDKRIDSKRMHLLCEVFRFSIILKFPCALSLGANIERFFFN